MLQARTSLSSLHFPQFLLHFHATRKVLQPFKKYQNGVIFQGRIHHQNYVPTDKLSGRFKAAGHPIHLDSTGYHP